MQCACVILSSVTCPAVLYFSISHRRHEFRGGGDIEHKMCVLISCTAFVCSSTRSKKNSTYFDLHVKCPHSFETGMKLEFS